MVRDTYMDYIRYKFIKEDYSLKRSLVLKDEGGDTLHPQYPLKSTLKTLDFVTKAVSFIPERKGMKLCIARDNTICRQIMKNLLTIEYFKEEVSRWQKTKRETTAYIDYRLKFNHLKIFDCENDESSKKECKKTKDKRLIKLRVIGEFDRNIIFMNDMLGTRL